MSTTTDTVEILDKESRLVELTAVEQGLAQLRADLKGVQFDVTTTKGKKAASEARTRCVSIRTGADAVYKTWNGPMLEKQRAMRAEVARIKEEVTAIEEPIDAQIKEQEARAEAEREAKREIERQRLLTIQQAIESIRGHATFAVGEKPEIVRNVINTLTAREISLDEFGDHTGHAEMAKAETLEKLEQILAGAEAQEAEQARLAAEREELAKLRAEQEERNRIAEAKRVDDQRVADAAAVAQAQRIQDERDQLEAERKAQAAIQEQAAADARAAQKKLDDDRAQFEAEKQAEAKRQQDAFDAEEKRIAEQAAAEQKRIDDAAAAAQKLIDDAAAAEAQRIQEEADERARVALREAQVREAEEARQRAAREAAETTVRNASEQMLEALRMWKRADESGNPDELAAARHERDAAIDIATLVDAEFNH